MIFLPALFAIVVICAIVSIVLSALCWHFSSKTGVEGAPGVTGALALGFGIVSILSAVRIVIVCSNWVGA